MKLLERVTDFSIHQMVNIDEMLLAFVSGIGTTYAIFIVYQLKKYISATGKRLYFAFADLEKAFNHVPRKVMWWALRSLCVDEWAVRIMQGMNHNAWGRVRVNVQ